tara:strand:- start:250 stop:357 length:108 start_codon:yes stop_codon:yes gene_type:complete
MIILERRKTKGMTPLVVIMGVIKEGPHLRNLDENP